MTCDKYFLNWLADRLVNIYKKSPNIDFIGKLRSIARTIPEDQETPNTGPQWESDKKVEDDFVSDEYTHIPEEGEKDR